MANDALLLARVQAPRSRTTGPVHLVV